MARPDPRILTRTAVEVLQGMCTFLELTDIANLAQTCKCMGDQIIYGTDERSARTAGMILWREHPNQVDLAYASRVDSVRPLRAILSSHPSDDMISVLFESMSLRHIEMFKPHAHKIEMKVVKRNMLYFMHNSRVEQLMDMFPQLVHENDVLHYVIINSSVMINSRYVINDTAWSALVKLIKAGANTDYVDPSGRDLNDLARARHCYDKYRAALKKARSSAAAAGSAAPL